MSYGVSRPNGCPCRLESQLDAVGGNVQVSHCSNRGWAEHTEAHAMGRQSTGIERLSCDTRALDVEDHDVCLDPIQIQPHSSQLRESECELARLLMILPQALHVMAQRIYPRR